MARKVGMEFLFYEFLEHHKTVRNPIVNEQFPERSIVNISRFSKINNLVNVLQILLVYLLHFPEASQIMISLSLCSKKTT